MKKTILTLILSLVLLPLMAQPQQKKKFDPAEFKARATQFITEKASLTSDEAKVFFPIYDEFKDKQRTLQKQIQDLKHNSYANEEAAQKALLKIASLDKECAELESTYYKKICKVISPTKFMKVLVAEDNFHRQMIQDFNRGNRPGQGKPGNSKRPGQKIHKPRNSPGQKK